MSTKPNIWPYTVLFYACGVNFITILGIFNDSISTEGDMGLGLQKSRSNSVPRNPVVPRAKFLYNEFRKCSFKKLLTAFSIFLLVSVHNQRSNHYRRKSAITKILLLLLYGIRNNSAIT
jgi:large-conductance mechanosensitive channel